MTKKPTKIMLKADEAAVIIKNDGTIEMHLHDQSDTEPLSKANYMVGMLAFALRDESTLKIINKNFQKCYRKFVE